MGNTLDFTEEQQRLYEQLQVEIADIITRIEAWVKVSDRQPKGAPLVFMYSASNNEFSFGHFTLNRGGVPVTHWQPCVAPYPNQ